MQESCRGQDPFNEAMRIFRDLKELDRLKCENTELKQHILEDRQKQAFMEKFASLGKLAGGIVHEINNPLDAVIRYVNMLLEHRPDPEVGLEYTREIRTGLRRIMEITRSLREFSQLLNDNHSLDLVDIHKALDSALSLSAADLRKAGIRIVKKYQMSLPEVIDKGLDRVFSNIIKNALDAMLGSGGELCVGTWQDERFINISFQDSGPGVPEGIREKIFTPFFTTKPMGMGIGLGLPICFEVVQRYGGRIDLLENPGKGACFIVRLPVKSAFPFKNTHAGQMQPMPEQEKWKTAL